MRPLGRWSLVNRKLEVAPGETKVVSLIFRPEIDVASPFIMWWRQYSPTPILQRRLPGVPPTYTNCLPGEMPLCPPRAMTGGDMAGGQESRIDIPLTAPNITFRDGVLKTGFRVFVEVRESDPDDPSLPYAKGRRSTFSFVLQVVNPAPTCPTGKLCVSPIR